MAAQHDLILGRSWDQSINQSDTINIRYYICVEMYRSVTVIMDRKPKLDEGQAVWTAKICDILPSVVPLAEESHLSRNASHCHQHHCASQLRFTQHTCLL